ncbi:hypothetical protein [Agrobacterium tumefaciens]|uniref:hypothetical protein n=1 Tax=Agrobacterium tumefaciens TaxID=358 RepID=UPI001571DE54|nr:hypothetical protein [Agrobacterium tumefaciens]WCJ62732.1 hypothetical protein G6M15_00575 [Agrobacterium tumefaciens]
MKISAQVDSVYDSIKASADDLAAYIEETLKQACYEKKWLYISRVKTRESFAQKLETGRYASVEDIDDAFACTIVVANIDEIKLADKLVRTHFTVTGRRPIDPNISPHNPENFSYDSLRLYCKVQGVHASRRYGGMKFEIQIKSFLEHAWAVATHDFSYKTEKVSWAKARIVAQLKAMLDNIELTISKAQTLYKSKILSKNTDQYQNTNDIIDFYLNHWSRSRLPKDLRRLSDCTASLISALKTDIRTLDAALTVETNSGKGTATLSLSPFQVCVQTLISQHPEKVMAFLNYANKKDKKTYNYKLLITSGMEIPDWLNTKSDKLLYVQGGEVA